MSRLLLSLVVLLLVCVCLLPLVNGADSQSRPTTAHGRKPNYSQKYLPTRPKKEMKRQELKDLPNYVPTMAYHEEPTRPPMPLWQAHWDVEDFHSSGNYDLEMSNVVDNAKYYANSLTVGPKTTWVFDIDETVLSGYEEMKSWGFGYVPKLSNEWIMNSSAPAIPQTKALYQQLIGSGFKIVFLTGRPYTQHDATIMNLVNQGFDKFDTVITRQEDELKMTAAEYKTKRRTILAKEEGYEIVGCVGDQWSDLHGEFTGFKVKLPNYIYLIP